MTGYNTLEFRLEPFYRHDDELDEILIVNIYIDGKFLQDRLTEISESENNHFLIYVGLGAEELEEMLVGKESCFSGLEVRPILSCYSCQDTGCASLCVEIEETQESIRWHGFREKFTLEEELKNSPSFLFEKAQYYEELKKLKGWDKAPYWLYFNTIIKVYDAKGTLIFLHQLYPAHEELLEELRVISGNRDFDTYSKEYYEATDAAEFLWALKLKAALGDEFTVACGFRALRLPVHIRLKPGRYGEFFSAYADSLSQLASQCLTVLFADKYYFIADDLSELYDELGDWGRPYRRGEPVIFSDFNLEGERIAKKLSTAYKGAIRFNYKTIEA